jgi:hypothetical protein
MGGFIGFFWVLGERERGRGRGTDEGEHMLFLSLRRASRGRRRPTVSFKTTPFWAFSLSFFFFLTVDETTSFFPKHVVSFKRKWRQDFCQFPN